MQILPIRPRFFPRVSILLAVLWLPLCFSATLATERSSAFMAALESIQPEELKEHVAYLADDELEGRESGSAGGQAAGRYLADLLGELGTSPAGTDGGFFQPFDPDYRNVIALIKGSDPKLSEEYILVGAHYDHVGFGTTRNSRGGVGQIHNGADDNASGVSGVLELIQAFTTLPQAPKRSIIFAFWDAEEKGLFGSKHWIDHPTVPLDRVVSAVTLDMIGRLRDERLVLYGSRTGSGLRRLASLNNDTAGLHLDFNWKMIANGDHYTFYEREIPSLFAYTGVHEDYHRPSDDVDLINTAGMRRVAQLMFAITHELANREEPVRFRESSRVESSQSEQAVFGPHAQPLRLGATWESEQSPETGVELSSVRAGSAAEKAGIKPGDRIVKFAGREIGSGDDLVGAVAGAANPALAIIQRPDSDEPLELSVTLDGEPLRLGISWRADNAEPDTVVVTNVVPGTPAAAAGLVTGDRIYRIAERNFSGEEDFAELAKTLPGPLPLLVERDGRLSTVVINFETNGLRQAA